MQQHFLQDPSASPRLTSKRKVIVGGARNDPVNRQIQYLQKDNSKLSVLPRKSQNVVAYVFVGSKGVSVHTRLHCLWYLEPRSLFAKNLNEMPRGFKVLRLLLAILFVNISNFCK